MVYSRRISCLIAGLCLLSLPAAADVDFANPEMVTTAIFEAARTGDDSELAMLCDPEGENDGDTRKYICEMTATSEGWSEYVTYFAKARVSGPAVIGGNTAKVPFLFGPDGTQPETMTLIRRGENGTCSASKPNNQVQLLRLIVAKPWALAADN